MVVLLSSVQVRTGAKGRRGRSPEGVGRRTVKRARDPWKREDVDNYRRVRAGRGGEGLLCVGEGREG